MTFDRCPLPGRENTCPQPRTSCGRELGWLRERIRQMGREEKPQWSWKTRLAG